MRGKLANVFRVNRRIQFWFIFGIAAFSVNNRMLTLCDGKCVLQFVDSKSEMNLALRLQRFNHQWSLIFFSLIVPWGSRCRGCSASVSFQFCRAQYHSWNTLHTECCIFIVPQYTFSIDAAQKLFKTDFVVAASEFLKWSDVVNSTKSRPLPTRV